MSDVVLGTAPPAWAERDAIHLAVIAVVAGERLIAGNRVKIVDGKGVLTRKLDYLGIVDPFIKDFIERGDRFWLCLMPGTVTGMRHHWMHPAFPAVDGDSTVLNGFTDAKKESELWLRKYAEEVNPYDRDPEKSFHRLLDGLRSKDLYYYGTDLHGHFDIEDHADELRHHAEVYLGIRIDWDGFSYSCSC